MEGGNVQQRGAPARARAEQSCANKREMVLKRHTRFMQRAVLGCCVCVLHVCRCQNKPATKGQGTRVRDGSGTHQQHLDIAPHSAFFFTALIRLERVGDGDDCCSNDPPPPSAAPGDDGALRGGEEGVACMEGKTSQVALWVRLKGLGCDAWWWQGWLGEGFSV